MHLKNTIKVLLVLLILGTFAGCGPNEKETLNIEALDYYSRGEFSTAIESFTVAIERYPEYSDYYTNRGMAYFENGQYELAQVDMDKAIELDADSPEAYSNRGYLNLALGNTNGAIVDLQKALDLKSKFDTDNGLYMTYLNLGTAMNLSGYAEEALDYYDLALSIDDEDPGVYNAKGMIYKNQGKLEEALSLFNQAIDLNTFYGYAYGNRASVFYLQGEYEIALADVNTAINIDDNIPQLHVIRGQIYEAMGEIDAAIGAYSIGVQLWPAYAEAYMYRAADYTTIEDYTSAIMDYNIAISLGNLEAHLYLGVLFRELDQFDDAIDNLQSYKELVGDTIAVRMEIGLSYMGMENYELAIENFDVVIESAENFADPYIYKALVLEYQLDYEGALEVLNQVLSFEPDNQIAMDEIIYINDLLD